MGLQAVCDALQFLLIFEINVRPQNVLRSLAVEIPFALGAMDVLQLNGPESVLDFGREQISVLDSRYQPAILRDGRTVQPSRWKR